MVKPKKGISTWTVFENLSFDQLVHPETDKMLTAIQEKDYVQMADSTGNALETVSAIKQPDINHIKKRCFNLEQTLL